VQQRHLANLLYGRDSCRPPFFPSAPSEDARTGEYQDYERGRVARGVLPHNDLLSITPHPLLNSAHRQLLSAYFRI